MYMGETFPFLSGIPFVEGWIKSFLWPVYIWWENHTGYGGSIKNDVIKIKPKIWKLQAITQNEHSSANINKWLHQ